MSSTGIKEDYFDYALFYNDISCLSDINCSGLSVYNSLVNSSLSSTTLFNNLNTLSSYSYLNISSTNNNLNNLSSYSYLNISSTNNNLNNLSSQSYFLTNYTNLNSLNVSGTTKLNGATSCISSLNVSGVTIINNNLNVSGASYFYGHAFAQQNIYCQSLLPAYDPVAPNKSLILNTRGYGNLYLNASGINIILLNNNNTSINSSLNVSGATILNNFTTINSPLYINTSQSTTISALNINCTSVGVLVNIVQNLGWNDGVNYALNVSGYSMFGGVQINGQDSNNIYKRVGI